MSSTHFFHLCTPYSLMTHITFLSDGRYTGMAMLLIPLNVLAVIGLFPSTPVLNITRVPLDCIMKMWVDEATDRCKACRKHIALSGDTKKRNFMDHVLRHVCVAVCGLCYKTGCTEHVARHCMRDHGQKDLDVSSGMLGRFLVHPDLLESFIAFSRGRGMTDGQEVSVKKAFAERDFSLPPEPQVKMRQVAHQLT